ncbi:MAG TPA: TldD/PmbA family protein [Elusimicrobiota bacterium]|nr:TldD/PmbA family protein [Elusimicrobiota bacterium]
MSRDGDLLERAERALEWVRKKAPGIGAEVYMARGRDRGVERKEGRVEALQESSEEGLGIRLLDGDRMAFAHGGGLGDEVLEEAFARAREQLRHLPADRERTLPRVRPASGDAELADSLVDPETFSLPLEGFAARLEAAERAALARDKRLTKALHSGYGESSASTAIVSTEGVRALESGTSASAGLSLCGEDAGGVQIGAASELARGAGALDFDRIGRDAAFRTAALLGAKKLPSRRRSVVLDPWVAGEFLEMLAGALSADAVQRGRSLFKGRVGEAVASPLVSFVDDPRMRGGLASALHDDEGVPTRRKAMIEGGVLKEFFHDAYTARREGRESNGCAGRAGFRGMPSPGPSNFFLAPGKTGRDELLRGTADGILVLEIMGMHTADAVSGEFSVGVSGVAVQGGELAHAVRGAMISANILDVLNGVDAVADDLRFYGSIASPTFRVCGLTVA